MRLVLFASISLCLSCAKGPPSVDPAAAKKAAALTGQAYAAKREGKNGAALGLLAQAAGFLPQDSRELASNLDDRATIELRMGRADEARRLGDRALSILRSSKPVDEQLVAGVAFRRRIADALAAAGIACREPSEPAPGGALPYFPSIDATQRELGKLGPSISGCLTEPAKPVTVTLVVTGTGRVALVETPGPLAGTPAEACVRQAVTRNAAALALPRFEACFRPFNVPFRIGKQS